MVYGTSETIFRVYNPLKCNINYLVNFKKAYHNVQLLHITIHTTITYL